MLFDPFELDTSVTPGRIREALRQREFTRAILMAFRLNEKKLAQEALEAVPQNESKPGPPATPCCYRGAPGILTLPGTLSMAFLLPAVEVVSASLPELYVVKVLEFLAASLEESRHLEFYLIWTQKLLMSHGQRLKSRYKMGSPLLLTWGSSNPTIWSWPQGRFPSMRLHRRCLLSRAGQLLPVVQFLQKGLQRHLNDISKLYVSRGWWAGSGGIHAVSYPCGV